MRALSPTENLMWQLDEAGSINFTMLARVAGELSEAALVDALAAVQARHPLLRVRIEAADDGLVFAEGDVPRLPLTIERSAWFEVAAREINLPIDWRSGPLARVTAIAEDQGFRLLVTMHHAAADATSGTRFVRDLLEAYEAVLAGRDPALAVLPVPQAQDDRIPDPPRGLRLAWRAGGLLSRQLAAKVAGVVRPALDEPDAAVQTAVLFELLDASLTHALAERARSEGTTVHGALGAAMLLAMAEDLDGGGTMGCLSALDVRGELSEPETDAIGLFVMGLTTRHRVRSGDALWDLARDLKTKLTTQLARGDHFTTAALTRLAPKGEPPDVVARRVVSMVGATVAVTNLGRLDLPTRYGPLELRELSFCAAGNAFPGSAAGLMVTTFAGRLSFNFVYATPGYHAERARAMRDAALGQLRAATS